MTNFTNICFSKANEAVCDQFRSGHLNLNVAMEMSTYLQKETEYLPWTIALGSLRVIEDLFEQTPAYKFYSVGRVMITLQL